MPLRVIPRGHWVLRRALLAQPAVTGSAVGSRIRTAVDPNAAYPQAVLHLIDQIEERPNEADHARVQIDIWGKGPTVSNVKECDDLAALFTSVLRDCDGDYPAVPEEQFSGGKIRGCTPQITLPSSDATRARVILDVEFDVSPAEE